MQVLRYRLMIASLLLSACSSSPVSQHDIDEATQAQTPSVTNDRVVAAEVNAGWINTFNDPVLVQLVEEAQSNNKQLQAAAANVERALALVNQAAAGLKPALNLAAGSSRSGSREGSAPEIDNRNIGLQLNWELDVWGRIRAGEQASIASAQAAMADYRYAQQSLAATTIKAYATTIEAKLQTEIVRETLKSLEETLRIVNVRYQNGLASAQDLALTRSDIAAAREQLTAIEGSQRDAVRALEILLGRYPSAELALRDSLPDIPPSPPAGIPSDLLERRADIVAAERRVAAAFNAVAQAKAARLPSFSLTSNIGGASSSLSNVLDPANTSWQLGANLLAPLFDGGARKAQVKISKAEQKQALAAYGQAALQAFSEIETYLDQGVTLNKREVDLKEALHQANKAHRIAKLRYKEGESDLLDVLTIQQRVNGTKSSLTAIQRLLVEQRVNLHLALGGNWER